MPDHWAEMPRFDLYGFEIVLFVESLHSGIQGLIGVTLLNRD